MADSLEKKTTIRVTTQKLSHIKYFQKYLNFSNTHQSIKEKNAVKKFRNYQLYNRSTNFLKIKAYSHVKFLLLSNSPTDLKKILNLLFPVWWQNFLCFVISSQSVNSALYQNQTEFGISVLQEQITKTYSQGVYTNLK